MSFAIHLDGGSAGSARGPFCNELTFCSVLEGCDTHPARVPCSFKKACCLRGVAPYSSLQVHLEAMWPNCGGAGPRGFSKK